MEQLEMLKQKKLEILQELDRVCRLAGIKYYLAYGTCLGAIRHKGFIPWDDDIDVFITYDAMEALLNSQKMFQDKYFIQSRETSPEFTNIKWELRDSSTAYFCDCDDDNDINHGIYIDIYVLFPCPDQSFALHKLIIDSYILRFLYLKRPPLSHGRIGKLIYNFLSIIYMGKHRNKKIQKIENRLMNNGGKSFYSVFMGNDITPISCIKFPQEYFTNPIEIRFEDCDFFCPSNPNHICEITYGNTYMEYPPEDKRKPEHEPLFVDFDNPFTKYKGVYYK